MPTENVKLDAFGDGPTEEVHVATGRTYRLKIEALILMRAIGIEELGGEHDQWNVALARNATPEEHEKILELEWFEGRDGWSYSCFT